MSESLSEIRIAGHPREQLVDVLAFMAPRNFWSHTGPPVLLLVDCTGPHRDAHVRLHEMVLVEADWFKRKVTFSGAPVHSHDGLRL
jgi:hypothetical protein